MKNLFNISEKGLQVIGFGLLLCGLFYKGIKSYINKQSRRDYETLKQERRYNNKRWFVKYGPVESHSYYVNAIDGNDHE